ncbi:hypothetical protein EGR_10738 [Echinococcus granulosus]|uniref:Uncharacterized protein n=1 Tax=Echinococcus granulosus TaxID=6210 RepID=W6TZZ6_ECHGR|nr:hypothetical protein EGR_10738 [Echinococcus granulosus]EUB54410.1 hypothetical protein EGR_10738 [Echinococcus granulosus]
MRQACIRYLITMPVIKAVVECFLGSFTKMSGFLEGLQNKFDFFGKGEGVFNEFCEINARSCGLKGSTGG